MNKRCALFNFWWSWQDAHGASLTALALYKLIEELGYEPCLVTTVFKDLSVEECKRGRHFRFIKKYARFTEKNYRTAEEYAELNDIFDQFILGSDQVLRTEWVPDEWFFYSINREKNKIVMSGSFGGKELKSRVQRIEKIAGYLENFSAISVREKDGIEVFHRYFTAREDIEWIMDPVFLVAPVLYDRLIENREGNYDAICRDKEIVLFYVLDMTPELERAKQRIAKTFDVVIVEDSENLMAEDFLYLVSKCKMVITDSFHGLCFSIILQKPVYCIRNQVRGTSRVNTIRDVFELENVILEMEDLDEFDFRIPEINYERINEIIEKERRRGRRWLQEKLIP